MSGGHSEAPRGVGDQIPGGATAPVTGVTVACGGLFLELHLAALNGMASCVHGRMPAYLSVPQPQSSWSRSPMERL